MHWGLSVVMKGFLLVCCGEDGAELKGEDIDLLHFHSRVRVRLSSALQIWQRAYASVRYLEQRSCERSQPRWFRHLFRMPPGWIPLGHFQTCPTPGKKLAGRIIYILFGLEMP